MPMATHSAAAPAKIATIMAHTGETLRYGELDDRSMSRRMACWRLSRVSSTLDTTAEVTRPDNHPSMSFSGHWVCSDLGTVGFVGSESDVGRRKEMPRSPSALDVGSAKTTRPSFERTDQPSSEVIEKTTPRSATRKFWRIPKLGCCALSKALTSNTVGWSVAGPGYVFASASFSAVLRAGSTCAASVSAIASLLLDAPSLRRAAAPR